MGGDPVSLAAARICLLKRRNESKEPPPPAPIRKAGFHKAWRENETNCPGMGAADLNFAINKMVIDLCHIVSRSVSVFGQIYIKAGLTVEIQREVSCVVTDFSALLLSVRPRQWQS